MTVYSFEMGLSLTFTLLDELSEASPSVLEKAMKNIYTAIVKLKTGLFKTDDYKFYAREEILNRLREYLLKLFKSDRSTQGVKELAVKLLIIIGNLRASGEDFLIAYNLIRENNMKINLDSELSLNKFLLENPSGTQAESRFKLSEKNSREIEILTGMDTDPDRTSHTAFAFDKQYMYLVNRSVGVFKVGLNKTLLTTPGFVYNANSNNRSYDKRQAIYVDGNLYIRGEHNEAGHPFEQVDVNTLEAIESEELKALKIKNKRNTDTDTWNKKVLEFMNYNSFQEQKEKGELEEYRTLGYTPLFTDGQHIYVIATYIKIKDDSEEYSGFEVETYCAKTWKSVNSVRLSFEPEEQPNSTPEQEAKVVEDSETAKSFFDQDQLCESTFATNGKVMAVARHGKMYFFDLETGVRLRDRLDVPNSYGGYDPLSNNFWFYKDSEYKPILKSFKVEGFKSREELTEVTAKNVVELLKQRTQKTVEEQKGASRVAPRSLESFLKKLGNKSNEESAPAEARENDNVHPSLYLIMYRGCEQVDTTMSELDSLYPDLVKERLKCQSDLFRSQYSVTVSATFVEEIVKALESFSTFTDETMTDENVIEQYQFLLIIKLVHRFINTLDRLSIKLIDIVEDQAIRTRLNESLTHIVSKLAESGIEQEKLQSVQNK